VTREIRFVVITTVIVAASIAGFYFLARHIQYGLAERPHIASIKEQLRALAAGQRAYHNEQGTYSTDVVRVWMPQGASGQGISLRMLAADSAGYVAEGRSVGWDGRCVVAVGPLAGDSLPPGEVVCQGD
jgi:uncharacterized protein YneF (UPF0154 family)